MDSMSRRLQELIADGNRALGRDASWTPEAAEVAEAAEAAKHGIRI
jgi:hypothetical protein